MTPKEKAKELVFKKFGCSKMYALIAVDEIIQCTANSLSTTKFSKEYWQEVKYEIINL